MHLCLMSACLYEEGGEGGGGRGVGGNQTHIKSAVKVTLQNVMLLGDFRFCFLLIFLFKHFQSLATQLQTWVTWQCVISSSSSGICHETVQLWYKLPRGD